MINTSPRNLKISLYAGLVGIFINAILSATVMPFATSDQIVPPQGAAKLPLFSQVIHMLVHHNQVMITSSLIIFAVIYASTIISLSLQI